MNINKITEIITSKGYEAIVTEVTKGSVRKEGIQIGSGSIKAVIYPENIKADSDEDAADKIVEIYEANKNPGIEIDGITEIEYVKQNMFVAVRRPVNDDLFAKNYLDMQLVLRVRVGASDDAASYAVKKDMAEKLNLTEEIFDEAIKNSEFEFKPMGAFLTEMVGEELPDVGIFVISRKDRYMGGAAIYDKALLKSIASLLDSDLIIIPSSIHGLLVVRKTDDADIAEMDNMVREVNINGVSPDEQLADHVYTYLKDSSIIAW